jgi:hypothetical protein
MKKTSLLLGLAASVIGGAIIIPQAAYAYRGDPNVKGPNYSQERHEAMEKAFETNDYNAWKNLIQGKGRVIQVINESNFAKFSQAHKLADEGKLEEAKKIRQELGLGLQNGSGQGQSQGQGYGRIR